MSPSLRPLVPEARNIHWWYLIVVAQSLSRLKKHDSAAFMPGSMLCWFFISISYLARFAFFVFFAVSSSSISTFHMRTWHILKSVQTFFSNLVNKSSFHTRFSVAVLNLKFAYTNSTSGFMLQPTLAKNFMVIFHCSMKVLLNSFHYFSISMHQNSLSLGFTLIVIFL